MIFGEKPLSPETLLPKVLLTAILVGIARWTAKLEKSHTEEARQYKQISLELETISPFIATLPEDEQREITRLLVDRYFVGRNSNKTSNAVDNEEAFKHPVQHVGETIKDLYSGKE